jgi:hypothetical protein
MVSLRVLSGFSAIELPSKPSRKTGIETMAHPKTYDSASINENHPSTDDPFFGHVVEQKLVVREAIVRVWPPPPAPIN